MKSKINIIDLNSGTTKNYGAHQIRTASIICINSTFHFVGGWINTIHSSLNCNTNNLEEIHTFHEHKDGAHGFGLVYSSKRKELFLLAGYEFYYHSEVDTIRKYSIINRKWDYIYI